MRKRTIIAAAGAMALGLFGLKIAQNHSEPHQNQQIPTNVAQQQVSQKEYRDADEPGSALVQARIKQQNALAPLKIQVQDSYNEFNKQHESAIKNLKQWKQDLEKGREEVHTLLNGPTSELVEFAKNNHDTIDPQDMRAILALADSVNSFKPKIIDIKFEQIDLPDITNLSAQELINECKDIEEETRLLKVNFHRDTIDAQHAFFKDMQEFKEKARTILDALKESEMPPSIKKQFSEKLNRIDKGLDAVMQGDGVI